MNRGRRRRVGTENRSVPILAAGAVVALRRVSFSHPLPGGGSREVLRDLSLAVGAGETLVVLGAAGAGKSTLAALLAGILAPDAGEVTRAPLPAGGAVLPSGLVTENPEDSFTSPLVREEMGAALENLGRDPGESDRATAAMLEEVGLAGHAEADPASLSGGQKQLLAIASVLVADPPLLVLDEPLSLLDSHGRAEVERLLARGGGSRATVFLSAEVADARRGDRAAVLHGGRIAWEGSPRELPADAASLAAWGLVPDDLALLGAGLRAAGHAATPPDTDPERMAGGLTAGLPGRPEPPPGAPPPVRRRGPAPFLAVAGLHFSYDPGTPRERPVLRGVDLEAWPGEVLGIVGAIGSGKTTLLRHLNGLLLPQRGAVRVGDTALAPGSRPGRLLHREVGLGFQFPEKQLFAETVAADVAAGLEFGGVPRADVGSRVSAALRQVGLDPATEGSRSPFDLSWGEQRLAALAGVIALGTPCVALDEPGAGLDPAGRRRTMELAAELAHREGRTVLVVSHHLDDLFRVADRVAVLAAGRIAFNGTLAELCSVEDIGGWGLAFPPLTRFARAASPAVPPGVRSVEEALAALGAGAPRR